jgi:hypothetical protein
MTLMTENFLILRNYLPIAQATVDNPIAQFLAGLGLSNLGTTVLNLIGAIIILIIGWIVAAIVAGIVKKILNNTDIDNRLADSVMGTRASTGPKIENLISAIVFWVLIIVTVVAFLNALQLTTVAAPLNNFLNQIFVFLPRLGAAGLLSALAWVVATLAKAIAIRSARSLAIDERINEPGEVSPGENRFLLSETLVNALYWFVFLFFLPLILGVLDLQGPLQPVQNGVAESRYEY